MEDNTDRMGMDYRSFDLPTPDPKLCSSACEAEAQCKAYTFVRPGVQGPQARCWLKTTVPSPAKSTCCISGVKNQPLTGINPLSPPADPVIYTNGNIAGVQNGPTKTTTFSVDASYRVTFIYTYHYFNGGKLPGTISLKHSDGTTYGPWPAKGAVGQGGVPNAYWYVLPNVEIKAGGYTVIDSDTATWSQNSGSGGSGFVEVRGIKTSVPGPTGELLKNGDFSEDMSGWNIEEWFNTSTGRGEVSWKDGAIYFTSPSGNNRIGVMQTVGKDVSGCSNLMYKAVVRADTQTLDGTGWQGREAPVAVYAGYIDSAGVDRSVIPSLAQPAEPQGNRLFWNGFYFKDPTGNSGISYGTKVQAGQWISYVVDLMLLNPKPKTLKFVGAQGAGWAQRSGAVTSISLVCNGYSRPLPVPAQPVVQSGMDPLQPPADPVIYTNGNIAGVQNGPTKTTTFSVDASYRVTFIYTYHYFNGGKLPGTISLKHSDGTTYGPWPAKGAVGQGGVPNAYWYVLPNVEIKAGGYTVIDSDTATWSQNSGSGGSGFVEVRGIKTGTPQPVYPLLSGMEDNTDRMGMDYRSFDLPAPDPRLCSSACEAESQCMAYTFVRPGVQGPQARCWLKTSVPGPAQSTCCISGVKMQSQPVSGSISGRWESSEGQITFSQTGNSITGLYSQDNGHITGTFTNSVLDGYWYEDSSSQRCSSPRTNGAGQATYYWGGVRFQFSLDTFAGTWGYCDSSVGHAWTGTRLK